MRKRTWIKYVTNQMKQKNLDLDTEHMNRLYSENRTAEDAVRILTHSALQKKRQKV